MYAGGVCWLAGQSPYDRKIFQEFWQDEILTLSNRPFKQEKQEGDLDNYGIMFPYPPTLGVIVIPLALFSWDTAMSLLGFINIVSPLIHLLC